MHYSVLLHPPDSELSDAANSPAHRDKGSEDKAANGKQEGEEEEEDAFVDAVEGLELQDSTPPSAAQEGSKREAQEGWMSEAAAIPTTLPSTSTEI